MNSPRWARALLWILAPPGRKDDVIGDLEETHRARRASRGRIGTWILTSFEALDLASALVRERIERRRARRSRVAAGTPVVTARRSAFSLLDVKLGIRMLVRFPGLTVVSTLAIGFAVMLGAGTYDFFKKALYPHVPFEDGDRIIEVENRNVGTGRTERRALHAFGVWREDARTLESVGAWHSFQRNVITDGGVSIPRLGAAVTADLLAIPRVAPLLGRLISAADEVPGAPEVLVLGYDVWRTQFGADPDIVGAAAHVGSTPATVVGVMPPGFEWPLGYEVWSPMQLSPLDVARGEGPPISVAARVARGFSREEVVAELEVIAAREAVDAPETNARLRTVVTDFGAIDVVTGVSLSVVYSSGVLAFAALLLLVAGNVALLLFARTAARESEIAVRSALGASRSRIVGQLLAESMLLGAVGAVVGLWGATVGLDWVVRMMEATGEGSLGFWFDQPLAVEAIVVSGGSALLAAALAGAVPAWKVTGHRVGDGVKRAGTGAGPEFGRLWALVIIAQVAVTVAFVPIVLYSASRAGESRAPNYGFAAEEYLAVDIAPGGYNATMVDAQAGGGVGDSALASRVVELVERVEAEPGVRGVALASELPGAYHGRQRIEIQGPAAPPTSGTGYLAQWASVEPGFFGALGVELVAGRDLEASDVDSEELVAIVNEDFVHHYLEDRNAVGRRFRARDDSPVEGTLVGTAPWYEIVGVVEQIPMTFDPAAERTPGYYLPLARDRTASVRMAIHLGRTPESFVPRLRELAGEVSRDLLLVDTRPLDDSGYQARVTYTSWFWVVLGAGGVGLLLATVGIYSIMAFTVARRTREIGVRVALGAGRLAVLRGIFSRAARHVGWGIAIGGVLIVVGSALFAGVGAVALGPSHALIFIAYLAAMSGVCALACLVPTARALAVEPTEALRGEG